MRSLRYCYKELHVLENDSKVKIKQLLVFNPHMYNDGHTETYLTDKKCKK